MVELSLETPAPIVFAAPSVPPSTQAGAQE
jgi:hypothetical protein